jgi:hypothetical protein
MARFHIHPWAKVGSLKNSTVMDLTAELTTMKIENDLRREVQENIRRLKDMGSYRGRRHAMGLPVRGQNTRTQVSLGPMVDWRPRWLTSVDCDCEKVEQDRTWWNGSCADVRDEVVECIILYSTAWKAFTGTHCKDPSLLRTLSHILLHLWSVYTLEWLPMSRYLANSSKYLPMAASGR